jgi:hypothetical protein
MAARYILGILAIVFLLLGLVRAAREGRIGPAARTWLVIGLMFGAVSLWLRLTGAR